jgi:hypothetical protein
MTPERTGRLRLLAGMVIANRPWRLVLGMRSALAAVMATSAYLVITSTIWQLASSLSTTKLAVTMVAAVIMMVVWIIGAHHLWRSRDELGEGWDPVLWNASTVLTLLVGVVTMAVAVFAFNIVVTVFFLEPPVYSSDAATWPGFVDHVRLAWLATGFATVAGAVGSGLDSDAAVEAAAYEGEQRREASREKSSSR